MPRLPIVRVTAALFGGLAAAAALFGVLVIASADMPAELAPTDGVAWIVPIIAGAMVGVLAWMLLSGGQSAEDQTALATSTTCPSCGSSLRDGWRLCPYCGVFLESEDASADEPVAEKTVA